MLSAKILYSYFHKYKIHYFSYFHLSETKMYIIYTLNVYLQCGIDSYFALKTIIKLMEFLKIHVIFDLKT